MSTSECFYMAQPSPYHYGEAATCTNYLIESIAWRIQKFGNV